MGTGQELCEQGFRAGPWLLERSPHPQRLASHARFMGASTDKGTLRREGTTELSPEPQCEPSRKRHLAVSATRARPSRPRAAIRKAYLTGLVDVAGQGFLYDIGGLGRLFEAGTVYERTFVASSSTGGKRSWKSCATCGHSSTSVIPMSTRPTAGSAVVR